jgi:creatinine amidohydrolase
MVRATAVLVVAGLGCTPAWSQARLSVQWEELTAEDFRTGIRQAQGTCLLPFGILEKHGPHLPLGTDLINVRHATLAAAQQEYAVVFPPYYFGQIFEAMQQPGTVAYSATLQLQLLQETVDEMARNGCRKLVIVNGHGGNQHLLPYFAQAQLAKPRDSVVYVLGLVDTPQGGPPRRSKVTNWHGGEDETSGTLVSRPDLVRMERAASESGADLARLGLPENVYTAIWWYARFPNHYSGEGALATRELGEYEMSAWVSAIVNAIRGVKGDNESLRLQNEFFEKAKRPLDTKPQ